MEGKQSESEPVRVWVNGSFDVLHIGHIKLLEYAARLGKVRVGTDTDRRIREKKGKDRPINTEDDRIQFLCALEAVDSVVVFDTDEQLIEQIRQYRPHFIVVGEEYHNRVIGGDLASREVRYFPKIDGKSSTNIINKL
jgi:rfaE bifunctional protein nucleotidyltransferase chain/domain